MSLYKMPITSAYGQNVKPFDGAELYFFEAGTTTPKASFSDVAETVAQTHPVLADANGRFPAIFISGLYKVVLKDKNQVQIWEEDSVQATGSGVNAKGNFDSSTNSSDYPASGASGDQYRVTTGFTLNSASGDHILKTGDFIQANKTGAIAIDADWDIIRGVVQNIGTLALADGANIATDCSKATVFTVTLAGDRTLDNPTNKNIGQIYDWKITQDGTGSRTLAFGTDFNFVGDSLIDPGAGKGTIIRGTVESSSVINCELLTNEKTGSVDLVDGANIATDASAGDLFKVTLEGNRTLDNPTNKKIGATYHWEITQDGTGGRTLAFGTDFDISANTIRLGIAEVTTIKGVVISSSLIKCEIVQRIGAATLSDGATVDTDTSLGNVFELSVAQTDLTSGVLVSGVKYFTETFETGDDFSNIADTGAAANVTGAEWTATGTTPTDWTNGSNVRRIPVLQNPTNKLIGQLYTWKITQPAGGDVRVGFDTDFEFYNGNVNVNLTANGETSITGVVVSRSSIKCFAHPSARITTTYWDTVNLHGSIDTAIQKFTNELIASNQIVGDVDNSATLGFHVTAKMRCLAFCHYGNKASSVERYGFSLNTATPSSPFSALPGSERVSDGSMPNKPQTDGETYSTVVMEIGDILRTHTNGIANGTSAHLGMVRKTLIELQ